MIIEYQNIKLIPCSLNSFHSTKKKKKLNIKKKTNENPVDHSQYITFSPNAIFSIKYDIEMYEKRVLRPVAAMFFKRLAVVYLLLSYRLCTAKYTSSFYALYTVLIKVVCL